MNCKGTLMNYNYTLPTFARITSDDLMFPRPRSNSKIGDRWWYFSTLLLASTHFSRKVGARSMPYRSQAQGSIPTAFLFKCIHRLRHDDNDSVFLWRRRRGGWKMLAGSWNSRLETHDERKKSLLDNSDERASLPDLLSGCSAYQGKVDTI